MDTLDVKTTEEYTQITRTEADKLFLKDLRPKLYLGLVDIVGLVMCYIGLNKKPDTLNEIIMGVGIAAGSVGIPLLLVELYSKIDSYKTDPKDYMKQKHKAQIL